MTTRTESRLTARFQAVDQHGHTHDLVERTDYLHISSLDGLGEILPGLKEYWLGSSHVNRCDVDKFETPDGRLQLTRI